MTAAARVGVFASSKTAPITASPELQRMSCDFAVVGYPDRWSVSVLAHVACSSAVIVSLLTVTPVLPVRYLRIVARSSPGASLVVGESDVRERSGGEKGGERDEQHVGRGEAVERRKVAGFPDTLWPCGAEHSLTASFVVIVPQHLTRSRSKHAAGTQSHRKGRLRVCIATSTPSSELHSQPTLRAPHTP